MADAPVIRLLAAAGFALALAAPASAEMYRWTDAGGQEHFTMDLHRVPPEYRGEAQRRADLDKARVDRNPPPINTMTTPDAARVKRALRPRYSRSRAAAASAGTSCSASDRNTAQRLARAVEQWEKRVELQEGLESRLVRTQDRMRAEHTAERYAIHLENAQQALEDFEDRMRRQGVPPGCYR
ncbi:MAG TPA: DUF4124 domain-containing protein [Myxococcota bacterium]|nr:DUF4124 domain-containing protein [Myxococcota bacterium]